MSLWLWLKGGHGPDRFEFHGGQWCETHPSSWSNTPRSRASRTGHTQSFPASHRDWRQTWGRDTSFYPNSWMVESSNRNLWLLRGSFDPPSPRIDSVDRGWLQSISNVLADGSPPHLTSWFGKTHFFKHRSQNQTDQGGTHHLGDLQTAGDGWDKGQNAGCEFFKWGCLKIAPAPISWFISVYHHFPHCKVAKIFASFLRKQPETGRPWLSMPHLWGRNWVPWWICQKIEQTAAVPFPDHFPVRRDTGRTYFNASQSSATKALGP